MNKYRAISNVVAIFTFIKCTDLTAHTTQMTTETGHVKQDKGKARALVTDHC